MATFLKQFAKQLPVIIASIIVGVLLPNNIRVALQEFLAFSAVSFLKYFYIFLIILLLCFLLRNMLRVPAFRKLTRAYLILYILIISLALSSSITIYKQLFSGTDKSTKFPVAIGGCFTLKDNEYLRIDEESEYIGDTLFEKTKELSKRHVSFIEMNMYLYKQDIPKFLPPLIGMKWIKKYLRWRTENSFGVLLYCINDEKTKSIQFIWEQPKHVYADKIAKEYFEELMSTVVSKPNMSFALALEIVANYYVAVIGQSLVSYSLEEKKFDLCHKALNDSDDMFRVIVEKIRRYDDAKLLPLRNNIQNGWFASIERLRGQVFYNQGQYEVALKYFLKAASISPYFPYESYEDYKFNVAKKYMVNLVKKNVPLFELALSSEINKRLQENTERVEGSVRFFEKVTTEDLISSLLANHCTPSMVKILEDYFDKTLRQPGKGPIYWYFKGCIVKFLPKGTKKINNVYLERVEESRKAFLKAKELDPEFVLIWFRLAGLSMLETQVPKSGKEISKKVREAEQYIEQGVDLAERLGLNPDRKW